MYDELKTRVVEPNALRTKYSNGTPTVKDKDSDKMIASRSVHVSNHCHICSHLLHITGNSVHFAQLGAKPTISKERMQSYISIQHIESSPTMPASGREEQGNVLCVRQTCTGD